MANQKLGEHQVSTSSKYVQLCFDYIYLNCGILMDFTHQQDTTTSSNGDGISFPIWQVAVLNPLNSGLWNWNCSTIWTVSSQICSTSKSQTYPDHILYVSKTCIYSSFVQKQRYSNMHSECNLAIHHCRSLSSLTSLQAWRVALSPMQFGSVWQGPKDNNVCKKKAPGKPIYSICNPKNKWMVYYQGVSCSKGTCSGCMLLFGGCMPLVIVATFTDMDSHPGCCWSYNYCNGSVPAYVTYIPHV